MSSSDSEVAARCWFALTVKPRHEKAAACALERKGIEEFLPLYRTRRRWSDRMKELVLPLFPGYVFCRFSERERAQVVATPGVRSIVGFGRTPAQVDDGEIGVIRTMIASGLPLAPWPYLRVGQGIRVEAGPLRGLEGILLQLKDTCRVIASVDLLQRSVAVEIDRDLVAPLKSPGSVLDPVYAWF